MHRAQYVWNDACVNSPIWARKILHLGCKTDLTGLFRSRDRHPLAHLVVRQREVTRGEVAPRLRVEQGLLDGAHLLALPAARVEAARRRRPRRARHVAAEDLPAALKPGR